MTVDWRVGRLVGRTMEESLKHGVKGYLEMWEDFGIYCENKWNFKMELSGFCDFKNCMTYQN